MKTKKRTIAVACLCAATLFSSLLVLPACKKQAFDESSPPSAEETLPETDNSILDSTTPETPLAPETPPVVETPTPPKTEYAQYLRCTGNNVNLRAGAGTQYEILGQAEKGTSYVILEKKGDWYKTYYRNKIAYVYASYASVFTMEKSKNDIVEDVISEGYKLMGVPYVYGAVRLHDGYGNFLGGFTSQKFDCSSLVQYVFYHGADKLLQTTTRTQVRQGKYVHPDDLQRGDCIFFTNEERKNKTGIERVGHVAIYLGDNYILHTASDYARIEKMSTYRWNFYIETRRFV